MIVLEGIGAVASAVLVVLALLFARRTVIERGSGTIELSLRLSTLVPGRGWASGVGRFVEEELRWYRVFSFAWRPRRVLSRRALAVESRRTPNGAESLALPPDWVIVRCVGGQGPIEIAMAQSTLAGFLSWVEAAPPGAASIRYAAR